MEDFDWKIIANDLLMSYKAGGLTQGVLLHVIYAILLGLMANNIAKIVSRRKNKPSREQKWRRKTKF
eukprot:6295579-Ditylum_brightwellii.AAC.1